MALIAAVPGAIIARLFAAFWRSKLGKRAREERIRRFARTVKKPALQSINQAISLETHDMGA
jgi:hypothetical protein